MSRKARLAVAVLAWTALAAGLRFLRLDAGSLWLDELCTLRFIETTGSFLDEAVHPPLYFVLASGWSALFGSSAFALRALSALLGVAAVPALAWTARELFPRRSPICAAALMAVSAFAVYFGQEARMYALTLLLVGLCLGWLWRALRTGRRTAWAAYVLCAWALLYTHNYGLFIASGVALALPLCRRATGAAWRPLLLAHLVIAAGYLPWLVHLLGSQVHIPGLVWIPPPTLAELPGTLLCFLGLHYFARTGALAGLGYGGLALTVLPVCGVLLLALGGAWRERRQEAEEAGAVALLVGVLVGGVVVPFALSYVLKPLYVAWRYSILALPAFLLLLGLGLQRLRVPRRAAGYGLALLVVLQLTAWGHQQILTVKSESRELARAILTQAPERCTVVATSPNAALELELQLARQAALLGLAAEDDAGPRWTVATHAQGAPAEAFAAAQARGQVVFLVTERPTLPVWAEGAAAPGTVRSTWFRHASLHRFGVSR